MFKDYYALLEINFGASAQEIKTAYLNQCKKWHPDKNPNQDTTQRMQDINEAYLILKDKEAREKYDAEYVRFKQAYQQHQYSTKEDYTYAKYDFTDEILKKWVQNATNQAKKMAQEITDELRGSLKEAGKNIGSNILYYLIGYIFGPFVIYLLVKSCS